MAMPAASGWMALNILGQAKCDDTHLTDANKAVAENFASQGNRHPFGKTVDWGFELTAK